MEGNRTAAPANRTVFTAGLYYRVQRDGRVDGGNLADRSLAAVRRTARTIDAYNDGYALSCPVENTATNKWGLQGMAGNVQEWTQGAPGAECVACGGAWDSYLPSVTECGMAVTHDPATRNGSLGFRLILAAEAR